MASFTFMGSQLPLIQVFAGIVKKKETGHRIAQPSREWKEPEFLPH